MCNSQSVFNQDFYIQLDKFTMHKSEESTLSDLKRDQTPSQPCLFALIQTLQEEITHYKDALSKASQMIEIYSQENKQILSQNRRYCSLLLQKEEKIQAFSKMLRNTQAKTLRLSFEVQGLNKKIVDYQRQIGDLGEKIITVNERINKSVQKNKTMDLNISLEHTFYSTKNRKMKETHDEKAKGRFQTDKKKSQNKWVSGEIWNKVKHGQRLATYSTFYETPKKQKQYRFTNEL